MCSARPLSIDSEGLRPSPPPGEARRGPHAPLATLGRAPGARRMAGGRRLETAAFSLLESLVATVFLSVALLGLASSAISLTRNEKGADSTSAAHGLVTQKLEQLRSLPLDAIAPGNFTDAANPLRADGATGGTFTRAWNVSANNTPTNGLRTVTVTVTWSDSRSHTTSAAAYVRCGNNPC
jgi:Tfp pilus assembly protein PilV